MHEYETKKVKISDIRLDGDNPNVMDASVVKRLKLSMKEFGNTQDIVIDSRREGNTGLKPPSAEIML